MRRDRIFGRMGWTFLFVRRVKKVLERMEEWCALCPIELLCVEQMWLREAVQEID